MDRPVVERTAELELDTAGALRAITDPLLLSEWLGRWESADDGDGSGTVTTDDGVRRQVTDLEIGPAGVRWTWAPADRPEERSDVSIDIAPIDDRRTLLTVTEVASAPVDLSAKARTGVDRRPGLDGIKWSVCLLVLQIATARATVTT